ncbi:MAG: hypothetical protein M1814_006733 [Vezdaea aestivalis]|nr:MAG: hypothetical protein M1814_006733 [Vezdaea aestivalis]
MRRAQASRRVARRIGSPLSSSSEGPSGMLPALYSTTGPPTNPSPEPTVKKPTRNKPKPKSGVSLPSTTEDASPSILRGVRKPPRSLAATASTAAASRVTNPSTDRPSYSASSLAELRSSTPQAPASTPSALDLDVASKFGLSAAEAEAEASIPSAAQIRERKERRQRLAVEERAAEGEADFISLETNEHGLARWDRGVEETYKGLERLEVDEEAELEGDEGRDGRLAISGREKREGERRRKEEIRAAIEEAEESGSGDSGDEGVRLTSRFEQEQIAKGAGKVVVSEGRWKRPRVPKMQPVLRLQDIEGRVSEGLRDREAAKERRMEVQRELDAEDALREAAMEAVQKKLDRVGEVYGRLGEILREKGMNGVET